MKKYVVVLSFAITMLFALAACGTNDDTAYVNDNATDLSNQTIPQDDYSGIVELTPHEDNAGIFHKFDNLGFSIEFPAFWEGKYGLEESYFERDSAEIGGPVDAPTVIVNLVSVYHIATREEFYILYGDEFGGRLLTLGRAEGEHFTYDNAPIMAGGSIFLAQTGGYTYFVNFPSGIEFNYTDPNSKAAIEYLEMIGNWEPSHWDFLMDSFRITD